MGSITDAFSGAFRDFVTAGVPASGANEPVKSEVRAIGQIIETAIALMGLGSMLSVVKATKALLDADLAHAAGSIALVYADSTDANNDLYVKSGGSGSGSWANTGALHGIIDVLAGPYAEVAIKSRAVVAGDVYAIRKEADDAVRVWAGPGTFHAEGESEVAIAAPGEQVLEDGEGYYYRASTGTFHAFALSTDSPAWQSNGDYYLLFANLGGEIVGAFRDNRHQTGFRVEKTGDEIQVITPELGAFTNKHMRLAFERVVDVGLRTDVWRWRDAVLVQRTGVATYSDIIAATDDDDTEIALKLTGKALVGGTAGNHKIVGSLYVFIDGLRTEATNGTWTCDTWELGQHTALLDPDSGGADTNIAYASMRWRAHMLGNVPALTLSLDFETLADMSIESLQIGNTAPKWNTLGQGCFDTVYRGTRWWRHRLDNVMPLFTPYESIDTIVKYAGEGIAISPGSPIVQGKGATMEVEILAGSDWTDQDRSLLISADSYGAAFFNWMGREFAPSVPTGTMLSASMQWRFAFEGD